MEQFRRKRRRRDGRGPTQGAAVMPLLERSTGMSRSGNAHTRGEGARLNSGPARNVVMEVGNSDLHAEREERQPKQLQAEPRGSHRSLALMPIAEFD